MLIVLLCVPLASTAFAQALTNEAEVCAEPAEQLDKYGYLRALSLDLRGRLPSLEEYAALDAVDDVPDALIDEWLASADFAERAVRRHREMLWNNIDNQRLLNNSVQMRRTGELYWRFNVADDYRGDFVPCLDEPAEWSENGEIAVTEQEDGTFREGWVWVTPYWAPDDPIKVCAFDAQETEVTAQGTDCGRRGAYTDTHCGCGPDLRWCNYSAAQVAVVRAMAEDLEHRVRANILGDEPYLELFTGGRAFVNGPLVHFWRYQTGHWRALVFEPNPMPMAQLPDLAFSEPDEWVEIELSGAHAGLLTSPAFLLRFQTDRSRANRFFNAFLCQPFVAPRGGLPAEAADRRPPPDLQQRDGCNYCHAQLEPASAYWGRWTQNGIGFLDPEQFPEEREDCMYCAVSGGGCSTECRTFYVTNPSAPEMDPWVGRLTPYLFIRDQHVGNIENGPAQLALERTVSGQLPDCTARSTATWLLGREVSLEEDAWIWEITQTFLDSNYSYRQLIRAIVTSAAYRRVR